ncbi:MAG: Mur ligase family protein [Rhodoferax sp.]|nr:Mur ligase family protein [Rhodoferax sp.]
MRLFNHDIRSSGPVSLGLGRMYAARALCITAQDDVIQLPAELKKHWNFIQAHYARVGLECCHEVVWDLRLEQTRNFPDAQLSCFYFGERENYFRKNDRRLKITTLLNSKNNLIELAKRKNIKTPQTVCFDSKDLFISTHDIQYPVYLKPSISTSGLGIVRCNNQKQLSESVAALNKGVAFQVQCAVDTELFSSYQFEVIDGNAKILLISDQIISANAHVGNRYPACYENEIFLLDLANYAVDEGIEDIFGFDVAVSNGPHGRVYDLIECNPRFTAATYPALVARKLNINSWMSLIIEVPFKTFDQFDIKDIEYQSKTQQGLILISWGTIEYGRLMVMVVGTPQQQLALVNQIRYRLQAVRQTGQPRIFLTAEQISQVTGGEWKHCDPDRLTLTGINHYFPYAEAGDLFFDLRKPEEIEKDKDGLHLARVLKKNVSALVIDRECSTNISAPVLVVSNPVKALQDMAVATSLQFDGIKVQVIGSHGKTGFKTQLHHLMQGQLRVHAHRDSANLQNPVWRALASIPQDTQVVIIETAIPTAFAGVDRALYIRPNYIILTGIGFEHLSSHKTLDNLIVNKVSSLKYLRPGGSVLLNTDDAYFEQVLAEVKKVSKCKIYTFGSNEENSGHLIKAVFDGFQWHIKARILDVVVEYCVPLPENYAPLASVSVLLMAKLLGCDLHQCTARYPSYQHFESSGNLYEVSLTSGRFQVYDQSRRGEWKGFLSMFELMSRFKPERQGRKVAVISELINQQDNPNAPIDLLEMRTAMARAGIDALFTVANFKDHALAFPDGVNWIAHEADSAAIHASVLGYVSDDDVVFVRGVEKSRLDKLVQALLARGLSVKKLF